MMSKEYDLGGKVAIVTGAGRGIGKAIALCLAEAGADIVVAARTKSEIAETVKEIKKEGRKAFAVVTDVTKARPVENMVQKTLDKFGKLDVLVSNAGVFMLRPFVPMPGIRPHFPSPEWERPTSEEEWRTVIDSNFTSLFLCCRAVGPHMIAQGHGKIIVVTSIAGTRAQAFHTGYCSSKAAANMFVRTLALEWGRYHINVNAIAPGSFHTRLSAREHEDPVLKERMLRRIPLRRAGDVRELGLLAVYLASDSSDFMTGQVLHLDGGVVAGAA